MLKFWNNLATVNRLYKHHGMIGGCRRVLSHPGDTELLAIGVAKVTRSRGLPLTKEAKK
jgi:hypothetical protein